MVLVVVPVVLVFAVLEPMMLEDLVLVLMVGCLWFRWCGCCCGVVSVVGAGGASVGASGAWPC